MSTSNDTTILRRCTKCGEEKPATLEFFYSTKVNKLGLTSACRICSRMLSDQYRMQNHEKAKQCQRTHYANNRDKIRQQQHDKYFADVEKSREESRQRNTKWRNNNRKRYREIQLNYRQRHKARVKYNWQAWRLRNLERARLAAIANYHRRRARLLANGGSFTVEDILLAYRSQRGRCWHCGKHVGRDFHDDHLIPVKRGGSNNPNNIVISCAPCNLSKGAKLTQEWNGRLF